MDCISQKIKAGERSICPACFHNDVCKATENQPCIECTQFVPAADVRPVKRGRWIVYEVYPHKLSNGTTAYEPIYKCSACGRLTESYLRYDEPTMPEDADFPRYCGYCGARMDGDGK